MWLGTTQQKMTDTYTVMLNLLPPDASGRLLDVGCGNGALLAEIARTRPNLQCEGIDIVQANVKVAQETVPNARIWQADLWPALAAGPSWDYIISCGALFTETDPTDAELLFRLVNARATKGFIFVCLGALEGIEQGLAERLVKEAEVDSTEVQACLPFAGPEDFRPLNIIDCQHVVALIRAGTKTPVPVPTVPAELLAPWRDE